MPEYFAEALTEEANERLAHSSIKDEVRLYWRKRPEFRVTLLPKGLRQRPRASMQEKGRTLGELVTTARCLLARKR